MKKLLFIFLIALMSLSVTGQAYQKKITNDKFEYYVPNEAHVTQINITYNQYNNGWGLFGSTCAGCASYYYMVTRSANAIIAEDGNAYYYYFVFFFSNSYYGDGQPAATYMAYINYYLDETLLFSQEYLLLPANVKIWGAWLRSYNPSAIIRFEIDKIKVH